MPAEPEWFASGTTIRRRLAALSSLFEHLCDANAVTHNPVEGVKRPQVESYEGKTPLIHQCGGETTAYTFMRPIKPILVPLVEPS